MAKMIDGIGFKNMVDYAVRNLNQHVQLVNQLNVFPVPDGDTGTNMVTTIHKGLMGIGESIVDLPSVSKKFARSVVYEARGNSGVIVSQFLKGMAEKFYDVEVADGTLFVAALEKGVQYAYGAVANPVEGTMLTVVKDATEAVKKEFTAQQSVRDIVNSFIRHAKTSLEHTPELLAVLKESGVVDSGGAGVVYLFEGMKKYLDGESLDAMESATEMQTERVDYDAFNATSRFDYGYCTELLLQLLDAKEVFDYAIFKEEIAKLGDSLVVSVENDKVRVHIHTHFPETVFALCHKYGEFLASKIENMTVQHTELTKRILCSEVKNDGAFAIVAVAHDPHIQKLFIEMGADVSICAEGNVSTKDYLDAFGKTDAANVFVFPNSSDAFLSAMQAKKMYTKAKVTVINSRTIAECYAALPTVDFEETDMETVEDSLTEVINNLFVASIAKREQAIHYRDRDINHNEYYSFARKELIAISNSLEDTVIQTIQKVVSQQSRDVITVFYRPHLADAVEALLDKAKEQGVFADFFSVAVESLPCLMTISFE